MLDQLSWQEPKAYVWHRFRQKERRRPWEAARLAAIAFATVMGLRGLAGIAGENRNLLGWLPTGWVALGFAGFVAYALPWLIRFVTVSKVVLSQEGVNNNIVVHGAVL
ncbi:MAG: hypothetical protein KatS3mg110_4600 [Pirellulaceae bacterium]|nr:MAG: hypothetical protein KatS3mg110_4600 [Pirellulaceae bacterium]